MYIVSIHSPRAHQFISRHFLSRSLRNIRYEEFTYTDHILANTATGTNRLHALDYDGPVAVACDDSKIQAGMRLLRDSTQKTYLLVGATDGPIAVADPLDVAPL